MTSVNATITDSQGTAWAFGTYAIDFQRSPSSPGTQPLLNGVPFQEHGITGTFNSVGNFVISLPDVNQITPAGGQWQFTLCPNATAACSTILTGNLVTGVSVNLSSFLSTRVTPPQVSTSLINRAYNDNEVTQAQGGFYYDVTLNCMKYGNGVVFTCVGSGGGGGGTPGGAINQVQYFLNSSAFGGINTSNYNASNGQLDYVNLDNTKWAVTANNWIQTNSTTLTGGVTATITLTPCPFGIDGRDNSSWIYLTDGGNSEPVQLLGGATCRPLAASGTISFKPLISHSPGYQIGSGSAGIQETIASYANWTGTGGRADIAVYLEPAGMPIANGNVANYYLINAPISNAGINVLRLVGNNAVLGCNTRDFCINANGQMTLENIRMASNLLVNGWSITNTACAAGTGVITITTSAPHGLKIGDFVDVHDTDDAYYWGGSVSQNTTTQGSRVTAVTSNTVSYPSTNNNCGGATSGRASVASAGTINVLNSAYYNGPNTLAEGSSLIGLRTDIPGGNSSIFTGHFNNSATVMDDEGFTIDRMMGGSLNANKGGPNPMCSTVNPYCGAQVYAPGPFTGGSTVLWINNSDLTCQCSCNPVVAFNGNTVHLNNVVAQSQAKVAVQASSRRGGFGNVKLDNVYDEQGNCFNPDSGLSASMGYTFYNNAASISGGEGPQANIPDFGGAGGTQFFYYLIPNIGGTDAAPLFFGTSHFNVASTAQFPRVMPSASGGTSVTYTNPTYTVIVTTDGVNTPTAAQCTGGSPTACGSIITGMAQCAGLWCSFTHDPTINTSSYAIVNASAYVPDVTFWPGQIIMGGSGSIWMDTNNLTPAGAVQYLSGNQGCCVYTEHNNGNRGATVIGWSAGGLPATMVVDTSGTAGLKGGLNFLRGSLPANSELITLIDSNATKTLANANRRPTADVGDAYIGNDGGSTPATAGLAFGAPLAISNYINSTPTGAFLERLTAAAKEFAINTTFDAPMLSLTGCTGCGPFVLGGNQVSDNFARANGGLGANWTTVDGTCTINNNLVVFTAGSSTFGLCNYTAVSFSNDQYAEVTMEGGLTSGQLGGVGVRQGSTVPLTGYFLYCGHSFTLLTREIAGVNSTLATTAGCFAGDVMKLSVSGTTVTSYKNGIIQAQVTDNTIASGVPAILGQNVGTQAFVTRFYAGNANWVVQQPLDPLTNFPVSSMLSKNASNTDLVGELSFSAATTASYTWTQTYISHPECVVAPQFDIGASNRWWITYTGVASFTINFDVAETGVVGYHCIGRN